MFSFTSTCSLLPGLVGRTSAVTGFNIRHEMLDFIAELPSGVSATLLRRGKCLFIIESTGPRHRHQLSDRPPAAWTAWGPNDRALPQPRPRGRSPKGHVPTAGNARDQRCSDGPAWGVLPKRHALGIACTTGG